MSNQYEAGYQRLMEFAETTTKHTYLSISHTVGIDGTTKKRDRKLTAKGLEYQLFLLHEKKQRVEARLAIKTAIIEDLLYSDKNVITIKEELARNDDIVKLLIKNHEEQYKILKQEGQLNNEEHFEDVDQKAFIFQHKVQNCRRVQHLADDF